MEDLRINAREAVWEKLRAMKEGYVVRSVVCVG